MWWILLFIPIIYDGLIFLFQWHNRRRQIIFESSSDYLKINQRIYGMDQYITLPLTGSTSCLSDMSDLNGRVALAGATAFVGISALINPVEAEPYDIDQESPWRYLLWPLYRIAFEYHGIIGTRPFCNVLSKVNMGQYADVKHALNQFRSINSAKKVILYGRSRGCATTLGLLIEMDREERQRVAAIILEAPYDTVEHVINTRWNRFVGFLVRRLLKWTSYSVNGMSPLQQVSSIPSHVPILVIRSQKDERVPAPCTDALLKKMTEYGLKTTVVELSNSTHSSFAHGSISDMVKYHDEVQKFYSSFC